MQKALPIRILRARATGCYNRLIVQSANHRLIFESRPPPPESAQRAPAETRKGCKIDCAR